MTMKRTDPEQLLEECHRGEAGAWERLSAAVYEELKRNAAAVLCQLGRPRKPGESLQTTALVNEAFIQISGQRKPPQNMRHFFGVYTLCMRRALLDHVKRHKAVKRGRDRVHVPLGLGEEPQTTPVDVDLLLDAIDALEREFPAEDVAGNEPSPSSSDACSSKVVVATLRLLMGWSIAEIGERLALPGSDVEREWTFARAFVRRYVAEQKT